jgi:hypothetical protein
VTEIPPESESPKQFTENAFRMLLRCQVSPSRSKTPGQTLRNPVVAPMDRRPDPAIAWVYGVYATLLSRLPSGRELSVAAQALRSGSTAQSLVDELMSSDEAEAWGAEAPRELGLVYITGCYLSVLGRWPDPGGLQTYLAYLKSSDREQGVLDLLMASPEAEESDRFPPTGHVLDEAVGRALQSVVLGQDPVDSSTDELAARYREGTPVVALVQQLALGQRRLRSRVAAVFAKRQLAALTMIDARLQKLQSDVEADREWAWRVNRHTWTLLEELQDRAARASDAEGRPHRTGERRRRARLESSPR